MQLPRPEYPRPDFVREQWLNLNGPWEFTFNDTYHFEDEARFLNCRPYNREIIVPFPYQSKLSGVATKEIHLCVWYRRDFKLPSEWQGNRILLHFGAVDYWCKVWLNGQLLGEHRGGHTPFSFEITNQVQSGNNELTVKVVDTPDRNQPRGKQSWASPVECWYTPSTGIWQTVWLEAVPLNYIEGIQLIPNLDQGTLTIKARVNSVQPELILQAIATFNGREVGKAELPVDYPGTDLMLVLKQIYPWSPEQPDLYDLQLRLSQRETTVDFVKSYFGLRKISIRNSQIYLNNQPYFQRLILDQGFWPDGLYTAPSDTALQDDIQWGKKLGFNGCRKHMKVEDPRFLYWADRLGYLVWGEFPACYEFSFTSQARFLPEWLDAIFRDYNHPAIVVWVPFNESWGIRGIKNNPEVQSWVKDIVRLTRLMDSTRLVIDNDGWDHVDSDIYGYHDYAQNGDELSLKYELMMKYARGQAVNPPPGIHLDVMMMAEGHYLPERPVMLTEFGGIGYRVGETPPESWGYADLPASDQDFLQRYQSLMEHAVKLPGCCGYVYTQLTDVEQEVNGLLTANRQPKIALELLRKPVLADNK